MYINSLYCYGYKRYNNKAYFYISKNTNPIEILEENFDTITLKNDEGEELGKLVGYSISSINLDRDDYIELIVTRNLSDSTDLALSNLEDSLKDYNLMSNSKFAGMTLAISPIIMRSGLSDNEAVLLEEFYPKWTVGFDYKQNWIIRYGDNLYRIGQDHTSQEQWVPGETGTEALYSKIEITEEGYEVWQEWDGVSGSYAKDQVVKDPTDEQLYKSLVDNNVWGPPSTQPDYWQLYVES